jgi:hypothetical protein
MRAMSAGETVWTDDDASGETWAEVGPLLLVVWPVAFEGWTFQVQRADDVLTEWVGCRDLEEASACAAAWAHGWLSGLGVPDPPAGPEAPPVPPPARGPFEVVGEFGGEEQGP